LLGGAEVKNQRILIDCNGRWQVGQKRRYRLIEAYTDGLLAYHESRDWTGWYSITHLPTGFCIFNVKSEAQAQDAMQYLNAYIDWSLIEPVDRDTDSPNLRAIGDLVKPIKAKYDAWW
jgi:hypothetical protein